MSRRDYSQKTFADTLVEGRSRRRKRLDRLERVDELLDWDRIDHLLDAINAAKQGGRGYRNCSRGWQEPLHPRDALARDEGTDGVDGGVGVEPGGAGQGTVACMDAGAPV